MNLSLGRSRNDGRFTRVVGGAVLGVLCVVVATSLLQPLESASADSKEFGIRLRAGSQGQPIRSQGLSPGVWTDDRTVTLWWEPANNRPIKYRLRASELEESVAGMARLVSTRVSLPGTAASQGETVWEGPLPDLMVTDWNRNSPDPPPSWPRIYVISFKLSDGAGNAYQGGSVEFNLVVDATQSSNPGW